MKGGGAPGRGRRFSIPRAGAAPRLTEWLVNTRSWRRIRRATVARLPFPTLRSDVRDVVYASWLVPVGLVARLVPIGLALRERGGLTPLTVLTYRHGHFGPRLAGPLRRLFPSPVQSNWRLYLQPDGDLPSSESIVLFIRNFFDSLLYVAGTRLLSDALPSDLSETFRFAADDTGFALQIIEGGATALAIEGHRAAAAMPADFAGWFGDAAEALRTICLQDGAIVATDDGRLAQAWIDLPIDLSSIEPLTVDRHEAGALLRTLGATATPWCFRVPRVRFEVLGERLLPSKQTDVLLGRSTR